MRDRGHYIRVEAKCKFCGIIIHPEIHEEYAQLRDPLNLLRLAACNRCADLRVERHRLEEKILRTCMRLASFGAISPGSEADQRFRSRLTERTKIYTQFIARWHGANDAWWEESFVDALMAAPESCFQTLRRFWTAYEAYRGIAN